MQGTGLVIVHLLGVREGKDELRLFVHKLMRETKPALLSCISLEMNLC